MKPFAYQLIYWSYGEVDVMMTLRSLRDIVSKVISESPMTDPQVSALYEDGRSVELDVELLRAKVKLDKKALRAEAKAAIEEDARAKAAFFKGMSFGSTCTGSPWLCDEGEDAVVEALVREREWRWKTLDEIDWAAFESSQIKA